MISPMCWIGHIWSAWFKMGKSYYRQCEICDKLEKAN